MSVRFRNRLLLLCPADVLEAANAAAAQVMGPGNESTFEAPYSTTGDAPATHYAACSPMSDDFVPKLVALSAAFPTIRAWVSGSGNLTALDALAGQVTVGAFDPHSVLGAMGLKPVS